MHFPPLPPENLRGGVGEGEFWKTGQETADLIAELVGPLEGARILDVGCGLGRVGFFLSQRVGKAGSYTGFDTSVETIEWCRDFLGLDPNQNEFVAMDLFSSSYNPRGRIRPRDLTFPWPDEAFDLVVATSLFTHLEAPATERYLREIDRVLSPGGRLAAGFFVLNQEALELAEQGTSHPTFDIPKPWGRIHDASEPEAAVAFDYQWLGDLALSTLGFELKAFEDGWWRQKYGHTYRDLIVLRKPIAVPEPPPEELLAGVDRSEFWESGRRVARQICDVLGDLEGKRILELGSGLGQVAFFLAEELGPTGQYTGLEIQRESVNWCQNSLGLAEENFSFTAVDLQSPAYNPNGTLRAETLVFPQEDQSFDFVIAIAVFSQLDGAATRNYLSEIHRVLKPGGGLYATFYVVNEQDAEPVEAGTTDPKFITERDFGRFVDAANPELGAAHDQTWLASVLVEENGFELLRFDQGTWRDNGQLHDQDIVVVTRPEDAL